MERFASLFSVVFIFQINELVSLYKIMLLLLHGRGKDWQQACYSQCKYANTALQWKINSEPTVLGLEEIQEQLVF